MKFQDMLITAPDKIRDHYRACRELAYNNAQMAAATRSGRDRQALARQMGYLMRQIEMMETIANRRRFPLMIPADLLGT